MLWATNKTIEENSKTDFEIWVVNFKLQFKRENIERSRPPLDSTTVCANMSDVKTLATESSARREKARK